MGSLGRGILAKACKSFRSRIEALFTTDGSFIEYVDCQCVSLLIFLLQQNRLVLSFVMPFKRKKKKNSGFIAATGLEEN